VAVGGPAGLAVSGGAKEGERARSDAGHSPTGISHWSTHRSGGGWKCACDGVTEIRIRIRNEVRFATST
jgi:hypothetical protein